MTKIPCGGFKLDENFLSMNENDELSLTGGGGEGKAYQYLVTDGEGNTKWEDRLAYDDSKLVVDARDGMKLVKVADEVPSWASVDSPIKIWYSNGTNSTVSAEKFIDFGNGSFAANNFVVFITTDNLEFKDYVFPEKGVYFLSVSVSQYITGAASADSDTPEITWDGSLETIKTIDPKYIPDMSSIVIKSSTSGSSKKFKITVDDSGNITATQV